MSTVLRFLLTVIVFLATGCAAPMSKMVSTRQGGTIDQHLFEKGDKVKVTYEDEHARMKTKKGARSSYRTTTRLHWMLG